jgi:hypothetical protein
MTISSLTKRRFNYLPPAIVGCCLVFASVGGVAQTPVTPPVHATDEHQLPAPFPASLPSIFIVGDSTANYHPDRDHEGYAFFPAFFEKRPPNRKSKAPHAICDTAAFRYIPPA